MNGIVPATLTVALLCEAALGAALVWSILFPDRRIWPLERVNWLSPTMVWLPTLAAFAGAVIVGIAEWNALDWPLWFRWGIGLPMIVAGNVVVWLAAFGIGFEATSGAKAELKTDGLYRWSRNPQYVADMGILIGWAVLSASPAAWIVGAGGVLLFVLAPFAEEPWLEKAYGAPYRSYRKRAPRFFGVPQERT